MPTAPKPLPRDDELDELPPLDGDGEAPDPEPDYADLLDPDGDAGAADPFDDATGEDDEVDASDLDTGGAEGGWLDDAADAEDLDVGVADDLTDWDEGAAGAADFEEPGVGEEDFGLGGDESSAQLDAGEEGPTDADEEMREEDLPPLDADEQGDVDDADLLDAGLALDLPPALPRAARAWPVVGAPVDLGPVAALAIAGTGVLAAPRAGAPLVRVDLEGGCEPLAARGLGDRARVRAVSCAGSLVAVVTEDGRASVSQDGGASFAPVRGWPGEGSHELEPVDVCVVGALVWARTRAGTLLRSSDAGASWEEPLPTERIAAIASDAGRAIVAVSIDASGAPLAVLRAAPRAPAQPRGSSQRPAAALPDAVAMALRAPLVVAASGPAVACASEGRGVACAADGERWRTLEVLRHVSALAFAPPVGTLLVAAYSPTDDATSIVRIGSDEEPEVVAELELDASAPRDDDGALAVDAAATTIAVDEPHGVVWVAGGFGLVALELPRA